MEESTILIAIITLGVGGVVGYLAGRSSATDGSSQKHQIEDLKTEINQYKNSVASHFQQTATMINEMNDSYKSVVQHLAKGSQDLCDAGVAKEIESRLLPKLNASESELNQVESTPAPAGDMVEPPRDYAPKKPDEVGALSENYGVQPASNDKNDPPLESISPPLDAAPKT